VSLVEGAGNTAAAAIMLGIAALVALQYWLGGGIGALYGPSKLVVAAGGWSCCGLPGAAISSSANHSAP
jgi:hypothetical protein